MNRNDQELAKDIKRLAIAMEQLEEEIKSGEYEFIEE